MTDLNAAIHAALGPDADLDAVDLCRVAEIVQRAFPHHSLEFIAFEVAMIAVQRGCHYFIWDRGREE